LINVVLVGATLAVALCFGQGQALPLQKHFKAE